MARVTIDDVKEILDTDLSDEAMDIHISAANAIITAYLSEDMTEVQMTLIERYLAAHFCAMIDRQAQSEKIDVISITYQGKTGLGLDFTAYGQQVKMLDTTGKLASMQAKTAALEVIDAP
jgi:hydrogenase maturation factor HypF (carbamoyltransferase family)